MAASLLDSPLKRTAESYASSAERIIKILRTIKKADVFEDFAGDIHYILEAIESGRDLYRPDMEEMCSQHEILDSDTKNFLMYQSDNHYLEDCSNELHSHSEARAGSRSDSHVKENHYGC